MCCLCGCRCAFAPIRYLCPVPSSYLLFLITLRYNQTLCDIHPERRRPTPSNYWPLLLRGASSPLYPLSFTLLPLNRSCFPNFYFPLPRTPYLHPTPGLAAPLPCPLCSSPHTGTPLDPFSNVRDLSSTCHPLSAFSSTFLSFPRYADDPEFRSQLQSLCHHTCAVLSSVIPGLAALSSVSILLSLVFVLSSPTSDTPILLCSMLIFLSPLLTHSQPRDRNSGFHATV